MELAFSALLLLLLLLPGFILQFTYTRGTWRWNSPAVSRPLMDQIPSGIVSAAGLHIIGYYFVTKYVPINLGTLMMLLLGSYGHDDEHFNGAVASFTSYPGYVAAYFSALYLSSALLGYIGHRLVRGLQLDHKFRFFRFNNEWFYYLSGEAPKFAENNDIEGEIEGVYLTTVVTHGEKNYLYTGFVKDYYFDKTGSLDRVILEDARRRSLDNDATPGATEGRYYDITGDYFILRYSEMRTINIFYIVLEEAEAGTVADVTVEESADDETDGHDTDD